MYNAFPYPQHPNIPPPNFPQPQVIYQQVPPNPPPHNFQRDRADSQTTGDNAKTISKQTKRKGNHSPKQAKHAKKDKPEKSKPKPKSTKKSDKIEGLILLIGDVNSIYHLNVDVYNTQLRNRFLHGLKNFKCESYTISATCQNEYATALADIREKFCGVKHPLLFTVFICQQNTDNDFEQFMNQVVKMDNLNCETFVGVLPESPTDMKKLSEDDYKTLIAHRVNAYTLFSKVLYFNIVTVTNYSEDAQDVSPKTMINRLCNKIKSFEPLKNKALKVQASVPAEKVACLSNRAKELLQKD